LIGDFSPKLVELTDRVLFDDVWERPELSKRDRSVVTAAALIALNRPEQLRFHLKYAVENGLTKDEVIESITHLGWPNTMTAIMVAKEIFADLERQPNDLRVLRIIPPSGDAG
jgi:4-carboxymuconolactone decarboxylase